MKKPTLVLAIIVAIIAIGAAVAGATDFSHDTSEDEKISKDKSLSQKQSQDEKDSKTKRKARTDSKGRDKTSSKSDKKSGQLGKNDGLDLSLPVQALFSDLPLHDYKLPADFGWTGDEGGGVINTTRADWFRNQAQANAKLDVEEQAKVQAYVLEILGAGARTGQAMINLQKAVAKFGAIRRDKDGNIEITGLGADDLQVLANGSMAATAAPGTIQDTRIKSKMDRIMKATFPACRFQGDITAIQCGTIGLHLSSPPSLKVDAVEWWRLGEQGGGSFAGLSGTYKVSSAWSWSQALEDAKGDSNFSKLAQETAASTEKMESEGRTFDAVMTKRKAVESMSANKAAVGPGKFMPGIH